MRIVQKKHPLRARAHRARIRMHTLTTPVRTTLTAVAQLFASKARASRAKTACQYDFTPLAARGTTTTRSTARAAHRAPMRAAPHDRHTTTREQ